MIASIISALLVSAAGIAGTAGILSGILSLFQKYFKPSNKEQGRPQRTRA